MKTWGALCGVESDFDFSPAKEKRKKEKERKGRKEMKEKIQKMNICYLMNPE